LYNVVIDQSLCCRSEETTIAYSTSIFITSIFGSKYRSTALGLEAPNDAGQVA
jgi:hypothetical protein